MVSLEVDWDATLFQKAIKGLDEIIDKVKLIVVHFFRDDQGTWSSTFEVELLRVFKWYKSVPLSMHNERRTCYFFDMVYVSEAILN